MARTQVTEPAAAVIGRTRVVLAGAAGLLGARAVSVVAAFVSVAIVSRGLSAEAFGLWSVLSSFALLGAAFDFGVGQAMRNRLAGLAATEPSAGRNTEVEDAQLLFNACLQALGAVALVIALVLLTVAPFLDLAGLLGASGTSVAEAAGTAAILVGLLFVLTAPLNLNLPGFLAYQEAGWRSVYDVLQTLLLLLACVVLAGRTSVTVFLGSYYALFDVAAAAALLAFLRRRRWRMRVLPWRILASQLRPLAGPSVSFWLLGIGALSLLTSDSLIAGRVLGLSEAGTFSATQRLFAVLITVHLTALTPVWSAYSHAAAAKDWAWIRRTLRRSLLITVALAGVGAVVLVLAADPLLELWVGREVDDSHLIMALAVWAFIYAVGNCLSMLLNGLGLVRLQTGLTVAGAVLNWPVSLALGEMYGGAGIVAGTVLVIAPAVATAVWQIRRVLARAQRA